MQELSTQDIELIKTANKLNIFKESLKSNMGTVFGRKPTAMGRVRDFLNSDVRTVFGEKPSMVMDRIRNAGDRTKEFLQSDVRTVFGEKPSMVMDRIRGAFNKIR